MRRIAYLILALLFFAVHAYYTVPDSVGDRLFRTADRAVLPFSRVIPDLAAARVVFVGELHDQPAHHAAQLRVIRAFHEAERPVAVGLEMFRAENQPVLDAWVAGELSLQDFLPQYYENWNFPWVYYRDIFLYAREHGIPLVGLNIPQETVQQVAREGFASLSAEQVGELPVVRCEVDAAYEEFIRRALGMHGQSGPAFLNFCEAQLVWDTAMAVNLLEFLEDRPQHAAVVVAGSGHAWKRGIPDQVRRIDPVPMRVVVPEIPERLERRHATTADTDYLWLGLELRL